MGHLAEKINHFLNEVILTAENQHEILVGSCTSDVRLTNTQEHILMLLSQESLTNSDLAKRLNVSQAAVTKAVKALVEQKKDARVTFYRLTDLARPIAEEHQHHHVHTLDTYQKLAEKFSSDEQEVIVKFLDGLIGEIGK